MKRILFFFLLIPSLLSAQRAGIGFWQQGSDPNTYGYYFDQDEWSGQWKWAFRSSPNAEPHIDSITVSYPNLSGRLNYDRGGTFDATPPVYITYPAFRFYFSGGGAFMGMEYQYLIQDKTVMEQPQWRNIPGYSQYLVASAANRLEIRGMAAYGFGQVRQDTLVFANYTNREITFELLDFSDNVVLSSTPPVGWQEFANLSGIDLMDVAKARISVGAGGDLYKVSVMSPHSPTILWSARVLEPDEGAIVFPVSTGPIVVVAVSGKDL